MKFQYSYKDPEYHKENDPPWRFPPENHKTDYKSNIIEIQGKNGSGKSTLLNIIALAFGYLKYDNELNEKKTLKDKLRQLSEYEDLQYNLSASSVGKNPVTIQIEKPHLKKKSITLNGKNVSEEELSKFDIIFLTEDDPRKVVTVSIGKINNFLKTLEKRINNASGKILQYNSLVNAYNTAKKDEKDTLEKIETGQTHIKTIEIRVQELKTQKENVDLRDELKDKYNLVKDETTINDHYWKLKKEVGKIEGKDLNRIVNEIIREESIITREQRKLSQTIEPGIRAKCIEFGAFNIEIDCNKLLNDDLSELKQIEKEGKENVEDEYQLKLVQDLIKTLGKHPSDLQVPTIDKQVSTLLRELTFVRSRLSAGSIQEKVTQLKKLLRSRETTIQKIDNSKKKVAKLEKDMEGFDDFKIIKQEFEKIEKRYLDLKRLTNTEKIYVIDEYEKLQSIIGNSEELETLIRENEVKKTFEEQTISRLQTRLERIKENMSKKPKYADQEVKLREKYEELFKLGQKITRWITIIENPAIAKREYTENPEDKEFGLSDYNQFIGSLGQYLGQMFEPVTFSGTMHKITFYDIERELFKTDENRSIYVQDLSVGQNKITALETSLRNLDPNKKGVVLIDEIADLDTENMGRVRTLLKQYYENGQIQFAILVRPLFESNSESVKIVEL